MKKSVLRLRRHGYEALLLLLVVTVIFLAATAKSETYFPVPATPDLAVSGSATADFEFDKASGAFVHWIYIQNDCVEDLYFDLGGTKIPSAAPGRDYPLLLSGRTATQDSQTFEGPFRLYSLGVSNAGATACTFTIQAGEKR
jgi:hypothetical protein